MPRLWFDTHGKSSRSQTEFIPKNNLARFDTHGKSPRSQTEAFETALKTGLTPTANHLGLKHRKSLNLYR